MENPEFLYHGSLYKQKELMPGFKRSGQLSVWDGVESNLNLYATTSKEEAYDLGIGSATEKNYDSDRFTTIDGNIWVFCQKPIDITQWLQMELYCYTIPFRETDGWVKNKNPYNNIDTEWTTRKTVHNVSVEQVDMRTVLKGRCVTITQAPMDVDLSQLLRKYRDVTKVYHI
ncbi:hypothetical protein AVT69_gp339 [Pseudomonas phage PhiPA3]|uniref:Uncharacterized protein 341 n=1 Tax=Pseudomonas phage PhiPA3 TaxID=998086 RepID=F8SJH7_BPPA3|nr:hypothetical protein AVT69_gp339 [Pseudomonas phage PhiPA3]AEH03764.1 hypothetical protein [Pseudomonas phage PhiPA3]